jgi:hypothetical protein
MNMIGRFFAGIFALITVILVVVTLWFNGATSTFLSVDTYKNGLAEQRESLLPVVLYFAQTAGDGAEGPLPFAQIQRDLPPQAWSELTNALIPPDRLLEFSRNSLDIVFSWLNGDVTALDRTIEFNMLLEGLDGASAERAANILATQLKPCTPDQTAQLRAVRDNDWQGAIPFCSPPVEMQEPMQEYLVNQFQNLKTLADAQTATLNAVGGNSPSTLDDRMAIPSILQSVVQLVGSLYLLVVSMIGLVVFFAVRSFKGFARWVGVIGLLAVVATILPLGAFQSGLVTLVNSIQNDGMSAEQLLSVIRLVNSLLQSGFTQFNNLVFSQVAVIGGVSLLLFLLSFVLRDAPPDAPQPAPATAAYGTTDTPTTQLQDTTTRRW